MEDHGTKRREFEEEATLRRAEAREENGDEELPHPLKSSQSPQAAEPITTQDTPLKSSKVDADANAEQQDDANVGMIRKVTACSKEDAARWLQHCCGNLTEAMKMALNNERPWETGHCDSTTTPSSPTLLEEAVAAYSTKPQTLQKRSGDVFVILDGDDLSRSCRLHSDDAVEASPLMELDLNRHLEGASGHHGFQHLFILKKPQGKEEVPVLARVDLQVKRADIELYTRPHQSTPQADAGQDVKPETEHVQVKVEDEQPSAVDEEQSRNGFSESVDWISGYESFLRIISHFSLQHIGIPQTSVESALPKIEVVARIAQLFEATGPDSVLETTIRNLLLNNCVLKGSGQLWKSIAKDAARWLVVAVQLQSAFIYVEAFKHVVGCYPDWPWSVSRDEFEKQVPNSVTTSIVTKSQDLYRLRTDIERQLLCLTLQLPNCPTRVGPDNRPTAWVVLAYFRDWITAHLQALDSGGPPLNLTRMICRHNTDECGSTLGVFRLLARGGDAYLPLQDLLQTWNNTAFPKQDFHDEQTIKPALDMIKVTAARLAAPLTKSTLRGGNKNLKYLTCIKFSEGEDIPWNKG